jgi:hypothetical protein
MSPEYVAGNLWRLLEGESVAGNTSTGPVTLKGPLVVRVDEYSDNMLSVQVGGKKVQVEGSSFEAVVKKGN